MGRSAQMPDVPLIAIVFMITSLTTSSSAYDPCGNYTVLDQPWRGTNESADNVCDQYFGWNGWYRLLYYGQSIRMPEQCSSGCSASSALWLNGSHPQLQDGVVTRPVCANSGPLGSCCSVYSNPPIRVKACPGNFFVYEFVKPTYCSAYCADINTITPNNSTIGNITTDINMSTNSSFDPCYNYTALDNDWRTVYSNYQGHDDTLLDWQGWYRLYLQGQNAQMSEGCLASSTCGGFTPLMISGSHPQIGDGVVTRDVYGPSWSKCYQYKSNPIQVKACPGSYYVYKLVKPDLSIPVPSYCAAFFSSSSTDPCYSYTALNDAWRSTNSSSSPQHCDRNINWVGWYRLFYGGQNARMPESCVSENMCGTNIPLWLSGSHPKLEDGVVVRPICGTRYGSCCIFKFSPIRVKACPGNYHVYEFTQPFTCNSAYCLDINSLSAQASQHTELQSCALIENENIVQPNGHR